MDDLGTAAGDYLRERCRLARNGARHGFFEIVDAVGRPVALAAHGLAHGDEDDFARPTLVQPGLDAHRRAAPARGPIDRLSVARDDADLGGERVSGIRDKGLARVTIIIITVLGTGTGPRS
jgi:hypothetical protein